MKHIVTIHSIKRHLMPKLTRNHKTIIHSSLNLRFMWYILQLSSTIINYNNFMNRKQHKNLFTI